MGAGQWREAGTAAGVALAAAALLSATLTAAAAAVPAVPGSPPVEASSVECPPLGGTRLLRGTVACVTVPSRHVGGAVKVAYWVPEGCTSHRRCPVLYVLHGFGGDHARMLGTADQPSALVAALTKAPPVDPTTVDDPWRHADPRGWDEAEPVDFVLVAPSGQTVAGGFGPAAGLDGYWTDWNPRYAAGGTDERYPTPPPRFSSFLTDELVPAVETLFPTPGGRESRALLGRSLGGYGAYANGLKRPDVWSSVGSYSGALNFLFAPAPQPSLHSPPVTPDLPGAGHLRPPSPVAGRVGVPRQAGGFTTAFLAFGDPALDQAYYRGNMPVDLARNARARAGPRQSLHLRAFTNDSVPRRAADLADPGHYAFAQLFETAVLPMNLDMEAAFDTHGVERDFHIHPGLHSDPYWNPFLRAQLQAQYARVRQPGGGGEPPPSPTVFDYRTVATSFGVWGWEFTVDRRSVEFLDLTQVSCRGLILTGTGRVEVTVPSRCGTGRDGARRFAVDLGPGHPTDEPPAASAVPGYGRTVDVRLDRLRPAPGDGRRNAPGRAAQGAGRHGG